MRGFFLCRFPIGNEENTHTRHDFGRAKKGEAKQDLDDWDDDRVPSTGNDVG